LESSAAHLAITSSTDVAAADPARLGEMMAALKAALERHGALYPVGADGRPLTPVLLRAAQ